ncbi:MAG: AAA family ATPase, partial [Candidatus Latescibacteria bacterium]|nr:AAA family ATPase [bacterium]MBD3424307.1 AAA family ATPase [Candidatus Latescibacterota bacterium]
MKTPPELEERYLRFLDGRGEIIDPLISILGEEDRLLGRSGAWAAAMLSRVYLVTGELERSLEYLRLSSGLFHAEAKGPYPFGLWINRALIMKYRGKFGPAGKVLRHVHRACLNHGQIESAARASSNLAVLMARESKTGEAFSHLEFSRRVYQSVGDQQRIRHQDLVEGVVNISMGRYPQAGDAVCRYLAGERGAGSAYRRFSASLLLAEVFLREGQPDKASRILEKADSSERIKASFPPLKAGYFVMVGEIARLRNKQDRAAGFMEKARSIMPGVAAGYNSFSSVGAGGVDSNKVFSSYRTERCAENTREGGGEYAAFGLVVRSTSMKLLLSGIRRASGSSSPLLITGETGTGKSVIARIVHSWSGRGKLPFVDFNASSLRGDLFESSLFGHLRGSFTGAVSSRKGLVEAAGAGTLFLDEISELDGRGQAGLLKFLDDGWFRPVGGDRGKKSQARIVAATNRNLKEAVKSGSFRADLYHRLSVFRFRVPPLRRRREDILPLASHFLAQFSGETGRRESIMLSEGASAVIAGFRWPGNVRQLKNEITAAAFRAEGGIIRVTDLSPELLFGIRHRSGSSLDQKLARLEISEIIRALEYSGGNRSAAARMLGIKRTTLL